MSHANSQDIIRQWIRALNERRIEDVLAMYSPQCSLLPTFSPHTLKTQDARRGYFQQLASRPGLEASLHDRTLRIETVAPGIELASGIYRFQYAIDDEPLVFEARFSFLLALSQAAPILHHHSSQIPRTLS